VQSVDHFIRVAHKPLILTPMIQNDGSAMKSTFVAIKQDSKNWKQIHHWKPALQVFKILFGEDRMPVSAMQ